MHRADEVLALPGCILGLALSVLPTSDRTLKCAAVYGVFGIVGFLSQMVLGIGARLLPIWAAVHAIVSEGDLSPHAPHEMPVRAFQSAAFVLWTAGVPIAAGALYLESPAAARVGACALLAATMLSAMNTARVARHAFRRCPAAEIR